MEELCAYVSSTVRKEVRNFKSGIVERYCNGHKYAGGSGSLSLLNVAVPGHNARVNIYSLPLWFKLSVDIFCQKDFKK